MEKCNSVIIRFPALTAATFTLFYLLLFQYSFITSGDAWAESFAEYLDEAIRYSLLEVFAQNWAGYFTLIPSFFTKLYVSANLPIGYADYYFRGVSVVFILISSGLIAARFNRGIITNDYSRIVLAIFCAAVFSDAAAISFINVWYLGFVPIILYSLHTTKLSPRSDALFGFFGFALSLTKPLPLLIPVLVGRIIRSRQYLGSVLILIGTTVQTIQLIFNDQRGVAQSTVFEVSTAVGAVFTGSSVEFLKLLNITPASYWMVVLVNIFLGICLILIFRARGVFVALSLILLYSYFLYTYLLAPDAPVFSGNENLNHIYYSTLKTQREILIYATQLLIIFLALPGALKLGRSLFRKNSSGLRAVPVFYVLFIVALFAMIYRPIDVRSSGVASTPLETFRNQLNAGVPSCVPLAPTPSFFSEANWFFSYKVSCFTQNFETNKIKPDFTSMETSLEQPVTLTITAPDPKSRIMTILLPIKQPASEEGFITLQETRSGQTFKAKIPGYASPDRIKFIAFDVSRISKDQHRYRFLIKSTAPASIGYFDDKSTYLHYVYFTHN